VSGLERCKDMKRPDAPWNRNIGVYAATISAIAILVAWTLGISAVIRKEFDPGIPQWLVVTTVAAAIVGVLLLIERLLRTSVGQKVAGVLIACLMIPFVATVFGGIYLWASVQIASKYQRGYTHPGGIQSH
jgi:hypothetical protein